VDTMKNLRLARFVKVVVDVVYFLLVGVCVVLILWMVIAPIIFSQADILGTASIEVVLGSGDEPQFDVVFKGPTQDGIHTAFVEEAEGTLRLETTSSLLVVIANVAKLLAAISLAYLFYLLRAVVGDIVDRVPFGATTGQRIRRLGYVVLLVGVFYPAVQYMAAKEILNRLPAAEPALNPAPTFDSKVILISLLVLLLAHVWSYGLELERDRALTV
jgi:hypothetical protein